MNINYSKKQGFFTLYEISGLHIINLSTEEPEKYVIKIVDLNVSYAENHMRFILYFSI